MVLLAYGFTQESAQGPLDSVYLPLLTLAVPGSLLNDQ
jgi:hypothetical protein